MSEKINWKEKNNTKDNIERYKNKLLVLSTTILIFRKKKKKKQILLE